RNSLRSTLPIHEGDDLTPAGYAAAARTARDFDSHLQVSVRRNADDTFTMFIDLPVTTVAANPTPAEDTDESDVMHVGRDVSPPQLISKVEPEYTEQARAAKYQGTVLLSTVIDADGRATNLKVIRSLGMGLDEKAIEAVGKWQFRPGMKAGVPVKVQAQIEVNFRTL
ncbi:MAG TPA: energy transducer TonB, partial [Bryobacteraceae bacterium]|nr:energy transducer TonB [Bryobacteraceae bacterium]